MIITSEVFGGNSGKQASYLMFRFFGQMQRQRLSLSASSLVSCRVNPLSLYSSAKEKDTGQTRRRLDRMFRGVPDSERVTYLHTNNL